MPAIQQFKPSVREIPCDFCGSQDLIFFEDRMRHGLNLTTKICRNCLLVQSNPQPITESLSEFYSQYYHLFHKRVGVDNRYVEKSKRLASRRFDLLSTIASPASSLRAFEIGPGAGQFMVKVAGSSRWSIEAIELGTESFAWCKSLGLAVENVSIEQYVPSQQFDLVVSFHVLEHIASPHIFLEKCEAMLKEEGLLYLEVPNIDSPGTPYVNFLQFPHLYNFSRLTLTNYLGAHDFSVIYAEEAVSYLTLIARKNGRSAGIGKKDFVRTNADRYLKKLKWKKKVYTLVAVLPSWFFLRKIKSFFYTFF